MADTLPSSLAEIIGAAQAAAPAADTPATPPAAAIPSSDTAQTTPPADTTTTDVAATSIDATATDTAATPVTTTDTATPDAATPPADTIDWGAAMPALAAKAQQILGEEAGVLTKYSDIDSLIRSIAEREKQVGQQSTYVGAFHNMAQRGVTVEMLQALMNRDVASLQAMLGAPLPTAPSTNGNGQAAVAWKGDYLAGRDPEGKPIFNRAALARDGLTEAQAAQLHAGWNDQLADIFRGPETFEQYLDRLVETRIGQATQQTEQKLTYAQQQAVAQQHAAVNAERQRIAYEASVTTWANNNANLLYVNKKDINGGATKFYQDMERVMGELNLPSTPSVQQLDAVKNAVLAMNRPAAAAAPTPSAKATRQPVSGAQPVKLNPDQFCAKYKDCFAPNSAGLVEWIEYETTGKVPDKR